MTLIGGLPAHPLIVHLIVVLLPLAAVGTVLVAARPAWRRHLGIPVFLLALVGVLAVPVATRTGDQLEEVLGGENPLVEIHEQRAEMLLPYAVVYLLLLAATVVLGRRSDRASAGGAHAATTQTSTQTTRQARLTTAVAVLATLAGVAVAGLVVWIGHAGATAVWQGVVTQ